MRITVFVLALFGVMISVAHVWESCHSRPVGELAKSTRSGSSAYSKADVQVKSPQTYKPDHLGAGLLRVLPKFLSVIPAIATI
jgi:hypothetical protein